MANEMNKPYQNTKVKKGKDSRVTIEAEITADTLERHRRNALADVRKELAMPGFRKGHVPEEMVLRHVDEKHLLEDAAHAALEEIYPLLIEDHGIEPLTSPRITVTKLAFGEPVAFTAEIGIVPEFSLPNYKRIAKDVFSAKRDAIAVSEKEADDVIRQVLEMRAAHGGAGAELTDEFVRTLGDFKDVADFKERLKENLKKEKERDARRMRRETFAKELERQTKLTLPNALIEGELDDLTARLERELEVKNMEEAEYFKQIGKTKEAFFEEQRGSIERQYKTKFILRAIAKMEHIEASEKEIRDEVMRLQAQAPDADPVRLYAYATEVLQNEKTLAFLEDIGTAK